MAAQIRSTIELLASILRENGTTKVRAETFRQAKFDQEEAVGSHSPSQNLAQTQSGVTTVICKLAIRFALYS